MDTHPLQELRVGSVCFQEPLFGELLTEGWPWGWLVLTATWRGEERAGSVAAQCRRGLFYTLPEL